MSNYSEEELKGMTRTQLRQAGIKVLQIDNKEICEFGTQDIIDKILAEQEGGNGKSATSTKTRTAVGRGRVKAEEPPKEDSRKAAPTEKKDSSSMGDLSSRVDALGATVDENQTKVMEVLEMLPDMLVELQKMQSAIFGLMTDLYKFTGEPGDLKDRLAELDEDWEKRGND